MKSNLTAHLAIALPLVAAGLAACEGCRSTSAPGASAPSTPAGDPPTVRMYLVSDLAGALEPCGCTKDQLGGLDHFGAWVRQSRGQVPAALTVASGPLFFMDDKLDPLRSDQDRTKAKTIARVLRGLDFAAFAPGANDWVAGGDELMALTAESAAAAIVPEESPPSFVSLVVRDAGGIKVGLVGYGQPARSAAGAAGGAADEAKVQDGVKHAAAQARADGANVVVALAAVGRGEAKRMADAVPELTAVVVGSASAHGDTNSTAPPPERVGDVLIVESANHLQTVAVLDLYVREPVTPGKRLAFADATGLELARKRDGLTQRIDELHLKISAWERDRNVLAKDIEARRSELAKLEAEREALDRTPPPPSGSFFRYSVKEIRESLGKDPATTADMAAYYKAVNEHNRTAFADRLPAAAGPDQASYVGLEKCSSCHPGPRQVYDATKHAHAYATLSSQFKEYNLECVGCHVTGYDKPGGSTVVHVDKLEGVQCEVCHGPGSKHVADPTNATKIIGKPPLSTCLSCHHPPHVEGFDPGAKVVEVLGPGHGRPAR